MPRPSVTHDGFLIPNAADVSNPRMAEPDRIDFNTLGQLRYGVIEGCLVTVSGSTASTLGGLAVVNGNLVVVAAASLPVGVGGAQDRFDLVGCDAAGTFKLAVGTPATDPSFPDPGVDFTTFAAVFAPTGTSSFSDFVVDKRTMLPRALLTKIDPAAMLVQNRNGTGNEFTINGGGQFNWKADTQLWRSAAQTLRLSSKLLVDETIDAGTTLSGETVTARGKVTGTNLRNAAAVPGTGNTGDLFTDSTTGRVYVWKGGKWEEIATISGAVPVGCIMTSVEPPSVMIPKGWIPLDGRTVSETDYSTLFALVALGGYVTGTAPNRVMVLPNATDRVLLTRWSGAGVMGGPANSRIALTVDQLPQHKHNVTVASGITGTLTARTGRTGAHGHWVSAGAHGHYISDPGHYHASADLYGNPAAVMATVWGGRNKIDALFNDRNHTYSVEPLDWTGWATTNISVSSAGSEHAHNLSAEGDHDHPIIVDPPPPHTHTVAEENRGVGALVDITPSYLTVYTYIRS